MCFPSVEKSQTSKHVASSESFQTGVVEIGEKQSLRQRVKKNSALTFSDKSVSCSGGVWGRCCLCLSIVRVNYSCKQYGKILISWAGFLIASPPLRVMSYGKRHPVCIQIDEITKPLLCNFSDLFITSFWRRGEGGEGEGFWVI